MKILLTNDDGIDAEGLQSLHDQLSRKATCFVVAPDRGRSCCGHAVTTSDALHVEKRSESSWTVDGTPADCVRIGLLWLKLQPDLVISGLNHGGNLGVDIAYSGTVAAAREACLLGIPSMAISQYMRRDVERDWNVNARRAVHVIEQVIPMAGHHDGFWSINLPAIPLSDLTLDFPITRCHPERKTLEISFEHSTDDAGSELSRRVVYKSNYQTRPRNESSDVDLCFSGHATISWISCMP
ncbi:MAG: 5'/3'-nucleotidase SurE [Pirellula sp.]